MPVRVEACSPEEAMQLLKAAILNCCCGGDLPCLCQCSAEYMLQPATLNIEFTDWEDCVYTDCEWLNTCLGLGLTTANCSIFEDTSYLPGGSAFNTAFGLTSSIQVGAWDACCTIA